MEVKTVLTRVYVHNLDDTIEFYEGLFQTKCSMRLNYTEAGLELAQVANILILCGSDKSLELFRGTNATFLVDSIFEYKEYLLSHGAEIIRDLKRVPTGTNMTVRHADGIIVEYVEHDKTSH